MDHQHFAPPPTEKRPCRGDVAVGPPPRPPPPRTSVQRVCLFCLMDKSTYSMDMMDNLTG